MSRHDDRSRRVARYVAARRNDLGLSQRALAAQADLNYKTVHALETGKHWPQTETRVKLAPVLGWIEGDFDRIADGGYPATGPLPEDDPDGLVGAVKSGASPDELEGQIREVIADLPERHRLFVEELYDQLLDCERQRRRLLERMMPMRESMASDRPSDGGAAEVI